MVVVRKKEASVGKFRARGNLRISFGYASSWRPGKKSSGTIDRMDVRKRQRRIASGNISLGLKSDSQTTTTK
ncbi:hypothetical protein WG66_000042 [Moniliophthora roreri]|nr:hypothetical protein WG66_000042 [Moniliophthora roreri]